MPTACILGTGSHVPDDVVTNDDLRERYGIETDDGWIRERTGIRARRFAPEGVGPAALAVPAVRRALDAASLTVDDVDLIVFCTLSPDKAFPGSGVYLQALLGIPDEATRRFPPCLDVRNQCSGFLYGLSHAWLAVQAGLHRHVLVVGSEVHSAALDLSTRGRAVASLFGDGAGAVVVGPGDAGGIRRIDLRADGRHADVLSQAVWDMSARPFIPLDDAGRGVVEPAQMYARMDGPFVFKHAVLRMASCLQETCAADGTPLEEVDLFLFHQANLRIVVAVQRMLELPEDRILNNIDRYGNTTAATLPLLMDEAVRSGRLKPGMRVALVAFGSGFTWGAALLDWTAPTP